MKLNWTTIKVVLAFVVIVGVAFWAVDAVRSRTYSATDLNIAVRQGVVTVTNPSGQPVAARFASTGSRTFTLASAVDGATGNSIREGTGVSSTQSIAFMLPTGPSEFTVTRGTNVNFVASSSTPLQAVVQPLTTDQARVTVVAAVVLIVAALWYASNVTQHSWLKRIRGQESVIEAPVTMVVGDSGGQGNAPRSYGDNL
jgi:uncharacterized membrane protein YwzB